VRSLRLALLGLAGLAAVLAALGVAVLAASDHVTDRAWSAGLLLVVMASYVGTGLLAWWRRPENRTGPLMAAVGFLFWLTTLTASSSDLIFTAGMLTSGLFLTTAAHLVLAYPTGRLGGRLERGIIVAGYALTLGAQAAWMLFTADCGCGPGAPANVLLLRDDPGVSQTIDTVSYLVGLPLVGAAVAILVQRWRRASRPARRELGALHAIGVVMVLLIGVTFASHVIDGSNGTPGVMGTPLLVAFALLPWAYLAGLLRGHLARTGAVSALVERLGAAGQPLRDAVAEALGDPTLRLAYHLPREDRWVGPDGQRVGLPGDDDPERSATVVEHGGETVGALVHDRALCETPELVSGVAAAAGLAMANERLQAELRARLEELRESRARLIEAGLAERRRLERDLHDGAQQRLVALSLQVGLAQRELERGAGGVDAATGLLDRARDELRLALEELRELARGIHPAVLTDRGLDAAVSTLAARFPLPIEVEATPPGRLPGAVEVAAYFVVSEALANMAKHAGASRASVRVAREGADAVVEVRDDGRGGARLGAGTGLQGLADRVAGLDGRLDVLSPPGGGTLVRARIPCASS